MISAGNPAHFVPFGRNFFNLLDAAPEEGRRNDNYGEQNTLVYNEESDLPDEPTKAEIYHFRNRTVPNSVECFEELYIRDKVVILSKNSKTLVKSFFMNFHVRDAIWCNFPTSDDKFAFSKKSTSTVCILGKQNLEVHIDNGEQISLTLPFEVNRGFETKNGLLLERFLPLSDKISIISDDDSPFPLFFSLSHPLNEVLPVIYKPLDKFGGKTAKYATNSNLSALHVDFKHSVLFCYDSKLKSHSLWSIKKATHEDALTAAKYLEQSMTSLVNASSGKTPSIVRSNVSLLTQFREGATPTGSSQATSSSANRQGTSSSSNLITNPSGMIGTSSQSSGFLPHTLSPIFGLSPYVTPNSSNPAVPSLLLQCATTAAESSTPRTLIKNRVHSPAVARLLGLIKQKAPLVSSPLPSIATPTLRSTPRIMKNNLYTPLGAKNDSTHSRIGPIDCSNYWPAEPLIPDLCLDHLWSEYANLKQNGIQFESKIASKWFMVEDFVGQKFFCFFLTDTQQLKCLKVKDYDDSVQVVHQLPEIIHCKDVAVALNSQITIILDANFTVALYSGVVKICFLHVNTSAIIPFGSRAFTMDECSRGNSGIFSSSCAPSFTSSPLKRPFATADVSLSPVISSEVYTNGDTPLLSEPTPVGTSSIVGFVSELNTFDVSSPYFIMQLISSTSCKISLPPLYRTPSVELCVNALCSVLSKEKSMQICCQWYLTNNSPSMTNSNSNVSNESNFLSFLKFLADLIGFQTHKMNLFSIITEDSIPTPVVSVKKPKCDSESGSDSDWDYVLNRKLMTENIFLECFHSSPIFSSQSAYESSCSRVSSDGVLFNFLPTIFWVLHSCYENLKLQKYAKSDLDVLCKFLRSIACVLKLPSFIDLYERDCSELIGISIECYIEEADFKRLQYPFYWNAQAWSIFSQLRQNFENSTQQPGGGNMQISKPYPVFVITSCTHLWIVHVLYGLFFDRIKCARDVDLYVKNVGHVTDYERDVLKILNDSQRVDNVEKLKSIFRLPNPNIDLTSLPSGVLLPLLEIEELLTVVESTTFMKSKFRAYGSSSCRSDSTKMSNVKDFSENEDGMGGLERDDLLKLRFSHDLRVSDVRRMLRSSKQVKLHLTQEAGTSDHDFREEQEQMLYGCCLRTMALPVGRGMFALRSCEQLLTENVLVPKLCLTGRSAAQNLTIELTHIEVPPNMDLWPQFHNGVSAALRIRAPAETDRINGEPENLNSAWIVATMPKTSLTGGQQLQAEQAGFLLGLGLNGHLANLALFNIHEYLVKGDSMTSIAVLLGVSAANCRSNDVTVMKMLATHVPFLLPPTLLELNVDPQIQNAAVVGVGLLCAESSSPRLAEALLREIGRPPTAQTDNFVDRESYALSCGLSLGLVMLGKGNLKFADPDFSLADELITLMNGGHKRAGHFATNAPASNIMKEGEFINVHVTSAPATLALGMMYLKSNDAQVASWLDVPETLTLLDTIRPDCLMLRVLCKNLILWDSILPKIDWIEQQLPAVLHKYSTLIVDHESYRLKDIDFETVAQSYCYVLAGACFALGMKFAGSANAEAFAVLIHYCKLFLTTVQTTPSIFGSLLQKAGKYTWEVCLNVTVLSLGMVMASTGNLDVMRIVRHIRKRLVTGVNYLVPHMTLGLLFLGAGRYCLKTDNLSIAVMLCAFYPKFPASSNDNRYHLQALRHLYVLACEPRILIPVDTSTNEIAYCNVRIFYKKTKNYPSTSVLLKAPCTLPELNTLQEVTVEDERYWPKRFVVMRNWSELRKLVANGGVLFVRRHSGFNTYKDDPLTFNKNAPQNLAPKHFLVENTGYKSVVCVNSFKPVGSWTVSSCEHLNSNTLETKFRCLHEFCIRHECLDALPLLINLYQSIYSTNLTTLDVWQLKLAFSYINRRRFFVEKFKVPLSRRVYSDEFLSALAFALEEKLISEVNSNELKLYIGKWVSNIENGCKNYLGEFLTFYDVVSRDTWSEFQVRDYRNVRSFVEKMALSKMSVNTIVVLQRLLTK